MVEVKLNEEKLSKPLEMFHTKYGFKGIQTVMNPKRERSFGELELLSIERMVKRINEDEKV
jgi:hypothetical protein